MAITEELKIQDRNKVSRLLQNIAEIALLMKQELEAKENKDKNMAEDLSFALSDLQSDCSMLEKQIVVETGK